MPSFGRKTQFLQINRLAEINPNLHIEKKIIIVNYIFNIHQLAIDSTLVTENFNITSGLLSNQTIWKL